MKAWIIFLLVSLAPAALAQETGSQKKWNDILAAAKKEAKVVVAGSPDPVMRNEIIPKFRTRFGISVELIAGRSSDIGARIRTERQAGIYSLDVFLSGLRSMTAIMYPEKMLDPLKPVLVLPEVVSPSSGRKGGFGFLTRKKNMCCACLAALQPCSISTQIRLNPMRCILQKSF